MQTAELQILPDGTVRCPRFGDVYASTTGAFAQAEAVFLAGIELPRLAATEPRLRLLELGFGLGSNFLATWQRWQQDAPSAARLDYLAVEAFPLTRAQWRALPARPECPAPLLEALIALWPEPRPGLHRLRLDGGRVQLLLFFGDVDAALAAFSGPVHGAYLDGFAPSRNPAMWSVAVCQALKRLLPGGARVASYSVAAALRAGLAAAGFEVQRWPGFAAKRHRLVAIRRGPLPIRAAWPPTLAPDPAPSVAVIGAGIAGLALVAALRDCACNVTVFDPGGWTLRGASGNPAVLLHADPGNDLPDRLHNHALRLALATVAPWAGHAVIRLDGVRSADGRCLEGGWVRPAALAGWLAQGAALVQARITTLVPDVAGGWWLGAGGRRWRFDHVVLAHGLAAATLWPALAPLLTVVAGQIELLRGDFRAYAQVPVLGERWLLPFDDTRALAGASYQPGVRRPRCSQRQRDATLAALRAQHGAQVQGWEAEASRVAVRVVSPDRRPLAGPLARTGAWQRDGWPVTMSGLWASLAHGSRGFASAFLAADLVAAGIDGRHPAVPRDLQLAVDPRRFGRR